MSKTVSELSAELGVSKQYLNRVLSQNNLGRKIGNKKLVSDSDVKSLLSILKSDIGNQKSETKNIVSDIPSKSTGKRDTGENGNQKSETKSETSFRYLHEQLEIKGKEVERLHQLLDQSQQLLLNEQKKTSSCWKKNLKSIRIKGFIKILLNPCKAVCLGIGKK